MITGRKATGEALMIRPRLASTTALIALAIARIGTAADVSAVDPAASDRAAEPWPADDAAFVRAALLDGRREVASSRETMTRTKREDVRSTAQMLMTEQMTLNAELETLAAKKGWTLGPPSAPPQPLPARPPGSPDALDRVYLETQIREHERSLDMFRRQSTNARDADVRELAAGAVPKLEQHLSALRKLQG
jgi:putative membrane protein